MANLYDEIRLDLDDVALSLVYLDEDTDASTPGEPEGIPLLRLEVIVAASLGYPGEEAEEAGWVVPAHDTTCTLIDADTDKERVRALLKEAAEDVRAAVHAGTSLAPVMDKWATKRANG